MENTTIVRGYPNQLLGLKDARARLKMNNELFIECINLGLINSISWNKTRKVSSYDLDDFMENFKNKSVSEAIENVKKYKNSIE